MGTYRAALRDQQLKKLNYYEFEAHSVFLSTTFSLGKRLRVRGHHKKTLTPPSPIGMGEGDKFH